MIEVEPGRAVMALEAGERHANPMGTLHGGVLCDLADAAMGMAYAATLDEGETFTTLELKINFLKPVRTGRLTAVGHVRAAQALRGRPRSHAGIIVPCGKTDKMSSKVIGTLDDAEILRERTSRFGFNGLPFPARLPSPRSRPRSSFPTSSQRSPGGSAPARPSGGFGANPERSMRRVGLDLPSRSQGPRRVTR
jgi:uncharacterized protein (TIGR00369 family)